jgi:site-specific DNA-methyltransferase (adenine-specific)
MWNVADQTIDGSETGAPYRQALRFLSAGFRLHDTMIYAKRDVTFPDANRYLPCFEFMFVASRGRPSCFNGIKDRKNRYAGSTIHGTQREQNGTTTQVSGLKKGRRVPKMGLRRNWWVMANRQRNGHPATMPPAMATGHIRTWTEDNALILDPFMGSGTTLRAATDLGRKSIGIETEEKYCEIAANRLAQGVLW